MINKKNNIQKQTMNCDESLDIEQVYFNICWFILNI